jgi:hypothetical protein
VEHCIGQIKRFHILSGRYRGQLDKDAGLIGDIVSVIVGTVVLQTRATPLRTHRPLLDDDDEALIAERAAEIVPARELVNGKPIGAHTDISLDGEGNVVGPGPEPDNKHINSGFRARDFAKGDFRSVCMPAHDGLFALSAADSFFFCCCIQVTGFWSGGGVYGGAAPCNIRPSARTL